MPKFKEIFDYIVEKAAQGYTKSVEVLSLDTRTPATELKTKSRNANANALIVTLFLGSAIGCLALLSIALSGLSNLSMVVKALSDTLFDLTRYLSWYVAPIAAIHAAKPYLELKLAERREATLEPGMQPIKLYRQTAVSADSIPVSPKIEPTPEPASDLTTALTAASSGATLEPLSNPVADLSTDLTTDNSGVKLEPSSPSSPRPKTIY